MPNERKSLISFVHNYDQETEVQIQMHLRQSLLINGRGDGICDIRNLFNLLFFLEREREERENKLERVRGRGRES